MTSVRRRDAAGLIFVVLLLLASVYRADDVTAVARTVIGLVAAVGEAAGRLAGDWFGEWARDRLPGAAQQ